MDLFWLDEAEPETAANDMENVRFHIGPGAQVANIYPFFYTKAYYDGMTQAGMDKVINLVRCAWAAAALWRPALVRRSSTPAGAPCASSFAPGFRPPCPAFPGGPATSAASWRAAPTTPSSTSCSSAGLSWARSCPSSACMGRDCPTGPTRAWSTRRPTATCQFGTGADNEIWSYGEKNLEICKKYIFLRDQLRPYIKKTMEQAHEQGAPVMRPLFYAYPQDAKAGRWRIAISLATTSWWRP